MRLVLYLVAALPMVLAATSGCQLLSTHDDNIPGQSPLKPAGASPDSLTMEIVWVRFVEDDPQLNDAVWQEIDESQLAAGLRRELANNGFRVGVVGGTLPDALARALRQGESPSNSAIAKSASQTVDLSVEPIVHGRIQQLRRNKRSEIQASEVYASMPLLVSRGHEPLGGQTYHAAQAIYALRVEPQPDRTALVELTPEVHHGAPRLRLTRGEEDTGVLWQAPVRDREVFNQLRMTVKLAPGEMLLLMSLPDAGSRLGHYFHTVDSADGRQQKLILIRLADVPPGNTFAGIAGE
jgi:hypothetical protein